MKFLESLPSAALMRSPTSASFKVPVIDEKMNLIVRLRCPSGMFFPLNTSISRAEARSWMPEKARSSSPHACFSSITMERSRQFCGKADTGCGAAAEGALFAAGIEQHDHEGEEHHDGAGVDDDLSDGEELRAEEQVEDGEGSHDDDEREGAVDGMGLQQEIDGSSEAESGKKEEQDQMHRGSRKIPPECK